MKLNLRQLFEIVGEKKEFTCSFDFRARSCMAASLLKPPWNVPEKLKTVPVWYGWFSV